MKVYLFGSSTVTHIPVEVQQVIENLINKYRGNIEFIVGDGAGLDTAYHILLSRLGVGDRAKVYCVGYARNNKMGLPTEVFEAEEGIDLHDAKIRQMVMDCDVAVCIWDKNVKSTFNIINLLKIYNKETYIYAV